MTILNATVGADNFTNATAADEISYQGSNVSNQVSLQPSSTPGLGWGVNDTFSATVVRFVLGNLGDRFVGDGRALTVTGGAGADQIWTFVAAGRSATAFGEGGDDTFTSSPGQETFHGGAFNPAIGNTVSFQASTTGVTASLANQAINTGDATGDVYFSIQNLEGSAFNDVLYSVADGVPHQMIGDFGIKDGVGGDDILYGATGPNAGYTNFIPGPGADVMHLGDGGNQIDYETAKFGLTFSLLDASINTGDAAGDQILGSPNGSLNIDIAGSTLTDTLHGNNANNAIRGDPFAPELYGLIGGNDVIFGHGGEDRLIGGIGGDAMNGGSDFDYAVYDTAVASVTANLASPGGNTGDAAGDTYALVEGLWGSLFNDILTGDGQMNRLVGLTGNDTLNGGDGDDLLNGMVGADQLVGGGGFDYALYDQSTAGVTADLETPGFNTGEAAGDTYATVEGLTGGAFNDSLRGDGGGNVIFGGVGDDQLFGRGGEDLLIGQVGADQLSGQGGKDFFLYQATSDSTGSQIDTIMDFEAELDVLNLDALAPTGVVITRTAAGGSFLQATTNGGPFRINFDTNVGGFDIRGMTAGVTVNGSSAGEAINGSDFADTLIGGGGADTFIGHDGVDTYKYTALTDSTAEASDLITNFRSGSDRIDLSGLGVTSLSFATANNVTTVTAQSAGGAMVIRVAPSIVASDFIGVTGGGGGSTLTGGASADNLVGTGDADTLTGGGGGDSLTGQGGADVFRYLALSDSTAAAQDVIADFVTGVDRIDLSALTLDTVSLNRLASGGSVLYGVQGQTVLQVASVGRVQASDLNLPAGRGADVLGLADVADTLSGSGGPDRLFGFSGHDRLDGGAGNDELFGDLGADLIYGGEGADSFSYRNFADSNTGTGADIIGDFISGVDRIDFFYLNQVSAVSMNRLNGGTFIFAATPQGNVQVGLTTLAQGADLFLPLNKEPGLKVDLVGEAGADTLDGSAIADRLFGLGGNDRLEGRDGDDELFGDGGADLIYGGAGADKFSYRGAADSNATTGSDIIGDFVSGLDKVDFFYISGLQTISINRLNGGTFVFATTPEGVVQVGFTGAVQGTDIINPAGYAASFGYDLVGEAATETLIGSAGNDRIFGFAGADQLQGGSGDDQMWGDAGADTLIGGGGADVFAFRGATDSPADGRDVVLDFSSTIDKLDFRGVRTGPADTWRAVAATGGTLIEVDLGGDGTVDLAVFLQNGGVTPSDVLF